MEYHEAGTGGQAKSTLNGKESATQHFVAYLTTKGKDYFTLEENEICQESIIRQFGTYLITTAKTKAGKYLKRDTAYDYFGGAMQVLKKKFKDNNFLHGSTFSTIVTEVKGDILKLIARRNISDGDEITEKSKGIGRNVMIIIGESWLCVSLSISTQ